MEQNVIIAWILVVIFSIVAFLTRDKKQKKEKSN